MKNRILVMMLPILSILNVSVSKAQNAFSKGELPNNNFATGAFSDRAGNGTGTCLTIKNMSEKAQIKSLSTDQILDLLKNLPNDETRKYIIDSVRE